MIRISVRAVKAGEHDRGKFRVYVTSGPADLKTLSGMVECPPLNGRFGVPYALVDAEDAATAEFEVSARLQERIADELGVLKVKKGGALRALLRAEAGKGTRRTRRKPV